MPDTPDQAARSLLATLRDLRKRYAKHLTKADRDQIDALTSAAEAALTTEATRFGYFHKAISCP